MEPLALNTLTGDMPVTYVWPPGEQGSANYTVSKAKYLLGMENRSVNDTLNSDY